MIRAVAVCPHPPVLVPELAPGTGDELAGLRAACDEAVQSLLACEPDRVIVLGAGDAGDDRDENAGGTLAGYGADVHAGGPTDDLPLSLTIGAWLLDRAGWDGPRTYSTGRPDTAGRVAVLAMAGGSAKRTLAAPGFLDERAEAFDASIAAALASGDPAALAGLDPEIAADLWVGGTATFKALAEMTKDADIAAHLRIDVAPYGVGYFVADWVLS